MLQFITTLPTNAFTRWTHCHRTLAVSPISHRRSLCLHPLRPLCRVRKFTAPCLVPTAQLQTPPPDASSEGKDDGQGQDTSVDEVDPAAAAASYLDTLNNVTAAAQRSVASPDAEGDSAADADVPPPSLARESIVTSAMRNALEAEKEGADTGQQPSTSIPPTSTFSTAQDENGTTTTTTTTSMGAYARASRSLWRLSWPVWWLQLLLTGISSAILLFTLAVPTIDITASSSAPGLILTAASVIIALISLAFTYSYTRLSLWLTSSTTTVVTTTVGVASPITTKSTTSPDDRTAVIAPIRVSARLSMGLIVAIFGLVVATLALQAVVGTLLARLLSTGIGATSLQTAPVGAKSTTTIAAPLVQPIDVLIVQAAANVITALLSAVILTTWFRSRAASVWNLKAGNKSSS